MLKHFKALLADKKGLTLVETLVALTILTLVLFCVTPLFVINFDTIKISGKKAKDVYANASILQKVLGNFETGDETANAGYDVNVANADITLSGNGTSYMVKSQGDLLVSNPENIADGYATVKGDAPNSCFQVFPQSLTDDFKEAYLNVAAIGFSFVDEPNSSIYKLYCNKDGVETLLTYGEDYTMRRVKSNNPAAEKRVMQIVLYGGTDVNFSNSPLTFKYKGYSKQIQIDAPSMVMVGEKSKDGYRYYVTRGETEKDEKGDDRLIVLERNMIGKGDAPLTSAMNDVAWVSAEDADRYAVGADGEKYGYYVMCGDNGQIRRFWQDKTTGNYYWGGDYTYYTDINHNRVEGNSYIKATGSNDDGQGRTLSTSVSYRFLSRRGTRGNEGTDGYQLVHGTKGSGSTEARPNDAMAVSANMWTVTALDDSALSANAYYYASDGKMFYYYIDESLRSGAWDYALVASEVGDGSFDALRNNLFGKNGNYKEPSGAEWYIRAEKNYDPWNFEALSWLKAKDDSYYTIQGIDPSSVNPASYPITLTSVGAIVLQGSTNIGNDKAYAGSTSYANYDVADGGTVIADNLSTYPTSTYTLYCGYIPAAYDVWSRKAPSGTSVEIAKDESIWNSTGEKDPHRLVSNNTYTYYYESATKDKNNATANHPELAVNSYLNRMSNDILNSGAEKNALWKGTFGVTPYLTSGTSINLKKDATWVYRGRYKVSSNRHHLDFVYYWPYTNIDYAVTGKFFDANTPKSEYEDLFAYETNSSLVLNRVYSTQGDKNNATRQQYLTGGKVMDITCSYYSHPFALHIAANPSVDSKSFMLGNNKTESSQWSYVYANRRETVTILKIASTRIPVPQSDNDTEAKDIAVSLAAGYAQGGSMTFSETGTNSDFVTYVNNIMPIGIVYLRAGTARIGPQQSNGMTTYEYQAIDNTGYKLNEESNYFHQFYYLNSKLDQGTENAGGKGINAGGDEYTLFGIFSGIEAHIGDMYGAYYWENNRHIVHRSADGGQPLGNNHSQNTDGNGSYNYVRCHPMLDTKVTCVAWGTTWNNNPEAMWGTDNGTVLSWWVDLNETNKKDVNSSNWNDKHVAAEMQSFQWIENIDNNYFSVTGNATGSNTNYKETVGAHWGSKNNYVAQTFLRYNSGAQKEAFSTFFDKSTQENGYWKNGYGFISNLTCINDITYANDYWVAVGSQSGRDPAEFCGNNSLPNPGGNYYGGSNNVTAYTGNGRGGSWINVRYWYDAKGTGKQSEDNATYLWKAVKISNNSNYNIVQINCLNGVWFATGYEDSNRNGEWDENERAVVCWARDPLAPCDGYDGLGHKTEGRWSENTQFYRTTGKGQYTAMPASDVGGINSVACRDDA